MKILAIETSCDDTGIAILEAQGAKSAPVFTVLSNVVASQIEVHQQYGGVFPAMAKREHQANLVPVLKRALKQAKLEFSNSQFPISKQIPSSKLKILNSILEREPELLKQMIPFLQEYARPDVDLIAVTNGPGLEPCLWVGVNFARALSYFWNIPIVAVNHIEGHVLVNLIEHGAHNTKQIWPAIALIVSGGHTQLVLAKGVGKYQILGETRDDAAGECFDKCAKIMGLGYPGGPEIARLASQFNSQFSISNFQSNPNDPILKLPRPMEHTKDYDFSFSGLKTAMLYAWNKDQDVIKVDDRQFYYQEQRKQIEGKINQKQVEMAQEVQQAIIDVLLKKTFKAVKDFKAKSIILGGGVSANQELRKQFAEKTKTEKLNLVFPEPSLSTDNGLMIAVTAYFHKSKKTRWQNLKAEANLRISK